MRKVRTCSIAGAIMAASFIVGSPVMAAPKPLDAKTRLFVPPPNPGAVQQVRDLVRARHLKDAFLIAAMELHSHGVWFTGGNPGDAGLTHFVIDTSRDGQGPWTAPDGKYTGDAQTWCNPPGRGLGLRPTVRTGNSLLDAYLWIKPPGESDGSCTRSTGGTIDPEWGIVDPAAGAWFPAQALQLAELASPPLI